MYVFIVSVMQGGDKHKVTLVHDNHKPTAPPGKYFLIDDTFGGYECVQREWSKSGMSAEVFCICCCVRLFVSLCRGGDGKIEYDERLPFQILHLFTRAHMNSNSHPHTRLVTIHTEKITWHVLFDNEALVNDTLTVQLLAAQETRR